MHNPKWRIKMNEEMIKSQIADQVYNICYQLSKALFERLYINEKASDLVESFFSKNLKSVTWSEFHKDDFLDLNVSLKDLEIKDYELARSAFILVKSYQYISD